LKLAVSGAERLPAGDWAERTSRILRAAAPTGLSPAQESQAGYRLVDLMWTTAAAQRHGSRLDAARRTADRMLALARLLVGRHTDQPAAHLALSEAYTQHYKNAWQTDDRPAIERNMRLALDAATRARALDPSNEFARIKVDLLQLKLEKLLNPD
jgi:hypothetical protein